MAVSEFDINCALMAGVTDQETRPNTSLCPPKHKIISKLILVVIVALLVALGTGYAAMQVGITSWKEEVLLHDGSKIIVERTITYGGYRKIEDEEPSIREHSIKFKLPGTKKTIVWKSEYADDIGRYDFSLVALDIVNGVPYIITKPVGCLAYNKWGRPDPPYICFKYDGQQWQQIPLQQLPGIIKKPNVVISIGNDEQTIKEAQLKSGFVSAEIISELNEDLTQKEFKTIVRTPLKGVGCQEMIHDGKGKWFGIDWFTSQPSYEACLKVCNINRISAEYCPCSRLFNNNKKGE